MSRKLEIRTRMAELQKEFSSLNSEVKLIEAEEKLNLAAGKFQDYKFRVGTFGYAIESEDKIEDASDRDRQEATLGHSGLAYSGFGETSDHGYILLKEKTDYARAKKVLIIMEAVHGLKDEKSKDTQKHLKTLLGEE